MSIDKRPDGSLYITEYTFKEWCESVQTAIQAGYEFSWENRDFPTHYSAPFTAGMKPIVMEERAAKASKEEPVAEVKQTSKESVLKDDSSEVSGSEGTGVPSEQTNSLIEDKTTKTAAKRTPTKKTT